MSIKNSMYLQLMNELRQIYGSLNIVQIGANDGQINDPIYEFVMENKSSTSIALVEPQSTVIEHLKKNYEQHPDATVYNLAVGSLEYLTLFSVKPQYYDVFIKRYLQNSPSYRVPSGFTSSIKSHVVKHVTGNLPEGLEVEEVIEEITIQCMTLTKLIKHMQWDGRKIHILQIDTEGMDDEIIYASDIGRNTPLLINFEHIHLSEQKENELHNHLAQHGYHVVKYSNSDTIATKFKLN